MPVSWQNVPRYIVCLHKNRAHQLLQGLNWETFQLQVSQTLYNPARGKNRCRAVTGSRKYMTRKKPKQEVDILFRPVVWDAPVQGDAVTELSIVAVFLILSLSIVAVLSQSSSSSPLAKASGSLHQPHGLRQTCQENDRTEKQSYRCTWPRVEADTLAQGTRRDR